MDELAVVGAAAAFKEGPALLVVVLAVGVVLGEEMGEYAERGLTGALTLQRTLGI